VLLVATGYNNSSVILDIVELDLAEIFSKGPNLLTEHKKTLVQIADIFQELLLRLTNLQQKSQRDQQIYLLKILLMTLLSTAVVSAPVILQNLLVDGLA
jgi:K+-transporting ATPase A subunit